MNDITTNFIVDEDEGIVAVELRFYDAEGMLVVSGSAKCSSEDKFDENVGVQLAYGRALRKLGRILLHEGNDAVHQMDKVKRRQREAAEQHRLRREEDRMRRVAEGTFVNPIFNTRRLIDTVIDDRVIGISNDDEQEQPYPEWTERDPVTGLLPE